MLTRARLLSLVAALLLVALAAPLAIADESATWVRGYPEKATEHCVVYIAQWSDSTYTRTPWTCDEGYVAMTPEGMKAGRGYPELGVEGCVWYVTQWEDGTYTKVPFSCPADVVPSKPELSGTTVLEAVVMPVASPAPAPTPVPAVAPVPPPAPGCCMYCRTGKPCGNSCISRDKTCHQPPGCACAG